VCPNISIVRRKEEKKKKKKRRRSNMKKNPKIALFDIYFKTQNIHFWCMVTSID
jgi:hypothetical protein